MADTRKQGNWVDDRGLRLKAAVVLGTLFLMFVITATLFLANQREVQAARQMSSHTAEVLAGADDLLIQALQQQSGIRGYALTADRRFLGPYEDGKLAFGEKLDALLTLTRDNPEQQARLSQIDQLMTLWHREFAELILAVPAGRDRLIQVTELAQAGRGKELMDALRNLSRELIAVEQSLLEAREDRLSESIENIRRLAIAMLVIAIVLTSLFMIAIQRSLVTPMNRLTGLIGRLTGGDLDVDVPYTHRGDEVGAIAIALESFRQASLTVQQREWIKSHTSSVGKLLSRQQEYSGFARDLLEYLCPVLGAGHGALFRMRAEETTLMQIGGYGYRERRSDARTASEGLVTQCARSAKPILLSPVPPDYVRIGSGVGEAAATQVMLWPLSGLDGVAGVIEIASFRVLTDTERELMAEVTPLAGLALEALTLALRTRELLEETQAQAEELQASEEALRVQQEELRAANEALEGKNQTLEDQGNRLRVSEEELRVQAEELRTTNESLGEKSRTLNEFNERLLSFQKELERKNDDLEQASRYKSEFLANMSHELRTPLNSLLILAKDLSDNGDGNLNADQIESARIIFDSGHSLLRLINDILDLSKIEAGRMDVNWEDVDLTHALTGIERQFRHVARERGLTLTVQREDGSPQQIRSDENKLQQVLTNLVGNALKFTHEGGVTVRIGSADATALLPPDVPAQDWIAITVADTGIGIAPDKLSRLFQAFEQGDGTTSRRYGGTGLGLSISRGIARILKGDIVVRSEPGQGSRFTLLLPRSGESAIAMPELPTAAVTAPATLAQIHPVAAETTVTPVPAASTTGAAVATSEQRPRPPSPRDDRESLSDRDVSILIIEDDSAFSRILADMARRRGYRALIAADGESGLELAARYRPNGILLDVGLPGMDGWTVMERLKSRPITAQIPVHFITATDDAERGLAMGAVGFMTKPATRESIEDAFARVLQPTSDGKRRVLVIDDEPAAHVAIRKLLAEPDTEITEARSIESALSELATQRYDCIVLDLMLPDGSGFDFLDRAAALGPVPPVVVYSARELTRDESLRLREYTDSIVVKGAQSPSRLLDEVSLFLHAVKKPAGPVTATAERPSDLMGRSVLLVDDDMRNVFALSKTLRAQGLTVVVAQDGRKALTQLEQNPQVDWVLMDIMMPDMDGYEATREIRKRPQWQDLPVIALTAKAMKGDREKCLEAGASDYLPKPIDVEKLLSMMRAWTRPR